jgi:hypothetical protein
MAWTRPEGSRRLRLPDFKVVSLSALRTYMKMYRLKYTHICTYSYFLLVFLSDIRVTCMLDRSLPKIVCNVYNVGQA